MKAVYGEETEMDDFTIQPLFESGAQPLRDQSGSGEGVIPEGIIETPTESLIQGSYQPPEDILYIEPSDYGGADWRSWRETQK